MSDQEQAGRTAAGDGRGALRVSHVDRDQVAELLRVAAGDGRLSSDELDERLEQALCSGHIVARPYRRSFWQWLRRAQPYAITA